MYAAPMIAGLQWWAISATTAYLPQDFYMHLRYTSVNLCVTVSPLCVPCVIQFPVGHRCSSDAEPKHLRHIQCLSSETHIIPETQHLALRHIQHLMSEFELHDRARMRKLARLRSTSSSQVGRCNACCTSVTLSNMR